MSKFEETVTQDTPRLVVLYKHEGGNDLFQWGVVGEVPIMSLIGAIVRVESEFYFKAHEECPQQALVIAWNDKPREVRWFIHPSIPLDAVVAMLETIKFALIQTNVARSAASQQHILGPDGQPARRIQLPGKQ